MLNKLNKKVTDQYGIKIKKSSLIKHDRTTSLVAKLLGDNGKKYALKTMYLSKRKQEFIVRSELLLSKKGVCLAKPVPTKDDKLFFMHKGNPYVLYEWVEGDRHPLNNPQDLKSLIKTIAEMHRASYNLNFPHHIKPYANTNWKKDYKKRIGYMDRFYKMNKDASNPRKEAYVGSIPFFRKMAKKALKFLEKSKYASLAKRPYKEQSLIHGDAHQGNVRYEENEKAIIDFEDVCYDLPSKDLIRIFSKYTKRHQFDAKIFQKMMEWYEEVNPISPATRKVILIDFLFPHTIHRMLRLKKYKIQTLEEVKQVVREEKKKAEYIYKKYLH